MRALCYFVALLLIAVVAGCIPTTTATINLGDGHSLSDMERAELAVEHVGFARVWFKPTGEQRLARAEYDGELVSGFESASMKGFGATVFLRKSDGRLRVGFAERNNEISAQGKQLLYQLQQELRNAFGEQVSVSTER